MNNEKNKIAEGYKVTVDRYGKNWWKKASSESGPSNKKTFTGQKGRNILKAAKKRGERERDLRSGKKLSSRMITNPDTRSNTRVSVKKESTAYHLMGYIIAEALIQEADLNITTFKRYRQGKEGRKYTGSKANKLFKQAKQGNQNPNRPKQRREAPPLPRQSSRMTRRGFYDASLSKKEHSIYKHIGMALAEAFAGPIASKYGDERGVKAVAKKTRDRKVRAGAVQAQKTIDKKVGVKTNPKAKDLVQVAMNKRRKSRSLPPGPFKTPRSYNK